MKQLVAFAAAVLLAGCVANQTSLCTRPLTPIRSERYQNSCGIPQYWGESIFPIKVRLNLRPEYKSQAILAVEAWNDTVHADFLIIEDLPSQIDPQHLEVGTIFMYEAPLGINEETETARLGEAIVRTSNDGRIQSALIRLDPEIDSSLIQLVIVHEIGHAMGLKHDQSNPRSAMFPLTWEPSIQHLERVDVEEVRDQLPIRLLTPTPIVPFRVDIYMCY